MKRVALFVLIVGFAAAVGFGLAMALVGLWGAIQGPFQREWDDTWRERIPVGLAYLTWGATIVAGLIIAWRVTHDAPRAGDRRRVGPSMSQSNAEETLAVPPEEART